MLQINNYFGFCLHSDWDDVGARPARRDAQSVQALRRRRVRFNQYAQHAACGQVRPVLVKDMNKEGRKKENEDMIGHWSYDRAGKRLLCSYSMMRRVIWPVLQMLSSKCLLNLWCIFIFLYVLSFEHSVYILLEEGDITCAYLNNECW